MTGKYEALDLLPNAVELSHVDLRKSRRMLVASNHSEAEDNPLVPSDDGRGSAWVNTVALVIWLLAGAVAFLPFALNTSPWDAVTLRVPGNQGNWWHLLVGAPFFLAFPMIWLRLSALFSGRLSTLAGRRLIWIVVGLSICGTILVESPFLLHLAGTSAWQRLAVLCLGLGIVLATAIFLLLRRRHILPARACLAGLDTAYLANAALCLVVYSAAAGPIQSRSGWMVTMVIVWPIFFELIWLYFQTFKAQPLRIGSYTA